MEARLKWTRTGVNGSHGQTRGEAGSVLGPTPLRTHHLSTEQAPATVYRLVLRETTGRGKGTGGSRAQGISGHRAQVHKLQKLGCRGSTLWDH